MKGVRGAKCEGRARCVKRGRRSKWDIQGETHTFGLVVAGTMTMMEGGVTGQALRGEARP